MSLSLCCGAFVCMLGLCMCVCLYTFLFGGNSRIDDSIAYLFRSVCVFVCGWMAISVFFIDALAFFTLAFALIVMYRGCFFYIQYSHIVWVWACVLKWSFKFHIHSTLFCAHVTVAQPLKKAEKTHIVSLKSRDIWNFSVFWFICCNCHRKTWTSAQRCEATKQEAEER